MKKYISSVLFLILLISPGFVDAQSLAQVSLPLISAEENFYALTYNNLVLDF